MSDDKTITLTLPVVIPAGLIPDGYEAVRVCSGEESADGEWFIGYDGGVIESRSNRLGPGDLRIVVRKLPTWTPPKSLKPGEYEWEHGKLFYSDFWLRAIEARSLFCDWTDPPRAGIWRINEDGTATYLERFSNANDR